MRRRALIALVLLPALLAATAADAQFAPITLWQAASGGGGAPSLACGATWTSISMPGFTGSAQDYVGAFAYGGGIYVASGAVDDGSGSSTPAMWYSSDGETWTRNTDPSIPSTFAGNVVFGDGKFLTVDIFSGVLSSTDGIHWTNVYTPPSDGSSFSEVLPLAYLNNLFIVIGDTYDITTGASSLFMVTSPDGVTWSTATIAIGGTNISYMQIAYANGTYVASQSNDPADGTPYDGELTSTSGTSWTYVPSTSITNFGGGFAGGGGNLFIAVGNDGSGNPAMLTSADALNWTTITPRANTTWASVPIYTDSNYIISGNDSSTNAPVIMTSLDGSTWSDQSPTSSPVATVASILYNGGLLLGAGTDSSGNGAVAYDTCH